MSSIRELHVITSGRHSLDEVLRMAEAAYAGGMNFLHIREKQRTAKEYMDWVKALANVIPLSSLIVNDRVDVAAASGCGGAHLAYHSLSPVEARMVLKIGQIIGRSVHSLEEAQQAITAQVDYLLYGHIFASGSKPGLAPRGTTELAQITARWDTPIIGLGGVTPDRTAQVLEAGCAGIAVLSGITDATDAKSAASAYREALDRWEGK
ncbi:thiamine phosphate synthase [Brevibacillus brevis]|uniref:Thiamine-phosphate synthase n=1 Tax=Brevibacillus brevis TaxID=1393 RepID=A0A517I4N8_BREBE|nr:thiamine phosphate synthase [Brevibacillus brevis]QDS33867.1 thiamine phosphate synthase [Brevibacillus brevis]